MTHIVTSSAKHLSSTTTLISGLWTKVSTLPYCFFLGDVQVLLALHHLEHQGRHP